ncbi:ThuA domain-containing protein [Sphingobium nicotianae]|uniref:ThuA domain-containing protein n=1 Tax=Sphingobium nicotianae TaxID=2782607 RepID=UPI001BE48B3C
MAAALGAAPALAQSKALAMSTPQIAALITGSPNRNHDYDFFRIRLNQALYDAYGIKADCYNDYEDAAAILGCDMLVTYTSQVVVSETASSALRHYLEQGGRWFALHSTNSVAGNQVLPQILGTRFLSHPPYQRFPVKVTKPSDPLLEGIADFEVEDELYCMETVTSDIEVLLHTRWGGEGFGNMHFDIADRPLMYKRKVGDGGILYLALGHANRPYDKPRPEYPDQPDHRGPWELPVYKMLIQRGIEWVAKRRPF